MLFMNEYDIERAIRLHSATIHTEDTVALDAALILSRLRDWANNNSDGWHSWPKPARAAAQVMTLLQDREHRYTGGRLDSNRNVTQPELAKAVRPIKAFLTRQGVTPEVKRGILGPFA